MTDYENKIHDFVETINMAINSLKCCGNCKHSDMEGNIDNNNCPKCPDKVCDNWEYDGLTFEERME